MSARADDAASKTQLNAVKDEYKRSAEEEQEANMLHGHGHGHGHGHDMHMDMSTRFLLASHYIVTTSFWLASFRHRANSTSTPKLTRLLQ